jgi:hypothetical protein
MMLHGAVVAHGGDKVFCDHDVVYNAASLVAIITE